jgi:lipopolysaccharide assembly outer membrane protein LptD (OstA)
MKKSILNIFLIILCLFFLLARVSFAQQNEKSGKAEISKEPLELLNADFSELRMEKDNVMVNLIGNVSFQQGDLNLKSSRAVWYRTAGQVVFIDSVRIEDSTQVLTADRVTYSKNSGKAVADGHVILISKKEEAQIQGDHGEYDRLQKFVSFTGSPSLVIKPNQGDSTITVTAVSLEYFPDARKGFAKGKVQITKSNMTATCDEATWLNKENEIVLTGEPEAEKGNDKLTGDTMTIVMQDEKVSRIDVEGDARASHIEVVDSLFQTKRESSLASRNMSFFLQDEKLSEVIASGNATSIYYPQTKKESQKTAGAEKNEASGDSIDLFMSDEKISRVLIKGGAMGVYVFPPENAKDTIATEDSIRYSANVIDYTIKENLINLLGSGTLQYGQVSLAAGKIVYQTQEEILVAEGLKTKVDDTIAMEESPVLNDGNDKLLGERMSYDLRSKRGKVKMGVTNIQQGTYRGELLRKITDKVLLADDGTYTTCDKQHPHYHFYARRMKIIAQDKVIAEPVVMYIADLPVAAIPYYVFPIKPGRHSGFLTFDFGDLQVQNRFIRNLGYYWAPSEYWDLKTAFDYYEGSGWLIRSQTRYAKRYVLNGNVTGSFNRQTSWDLSNFTKRRHDRWDLTFNHNQTITPTLSLTGTGSFLSDKNYWHDLNFDAVERRNRSLYSQASLSKNFKTSSLTVAVDHRWNLDTDERTLNLPVVRFNRTSLPLISPKTTGDGGTAERRWYNSIYYSLSSNLQNYNYSIKPDSNTFRKKFTVSDNALSLSAPQKFLGWLVLNPAFRYQETWYRVYRTNISDSLGIPGDGTARRGTYSTSLTANTVLYGTFNPKIGKLVGIRHVVTPSISFNWQPEFNQHTEYLAYTGVGGSGAKSKSMGFGMNHLIQIKTKSISGGKEVEKKFDLFNLNFSSGYNFLAKQHKLSNLSTSLRTYAIKNLDFTFSTTHDFYDKSGELKVLSPRWVYFSFDTHVSFSGKWEESKVASASSEPQESGYESGNQTQSQTEGGNIMQKITQSWNLDLTHRYSQSRGGAKTHWLSTSLRLPLTRKWLLNYLNRYDFSENKVTEQSFDLYRDMHCWEGHFTWIVSGYRKGYYFRINIKAMPEIKIEKGQGGLREVLF